jgi:pimeloyl-ACP methyl ester carboxylesterase
MGGYIALAMVRRHPERLAGLVLACSRAGADSESGRAGRYQMVRAVEQQGVGVVGDALLPRLFGPEAGTELVEQVRAMMHRQPAGGVIAALKAMAARPSSMPYLSEIDVPTLVVAGAHDQVIPNHESKRIADAIPGASLAILPGCGHLVNVEAPGAFNAAVRSFLDTADES